jgi:kynurenine formamidase
MQINFSRIVDLSVPIEATPSERVPVSIRYVQHNEGAREMSRVFGVSATDLPGSAGWAGEELRLISHAGTHVDAPWHYAPQSAGRAAEKIDELPLSWFIGPGTVIDLSHKACDSDIAIDDLEKGIAKSGATLTAGSIVMIYTGASNYWGSEEYPTHGAGLTAEAVLWLCRQGICVIGTDAFSLDAPFEVMKRRFAESNDPGVIWPAHFAGRETPYCQIEKLMNLDQLPPSGFWAACFPVKIAKASAAWTRAVAFVP